MRRWILGWTRWPERDATIAFLVSSVLLAIWIGALLVYEPARRLITPVPLIVLAVMVRASSDLVDEEREGALIAIRLLSASLITASVPLLVLTMLRLGT